MFYVMRLISRIPKNEKAQALTEYGLIIALVAILLVGALVALRTGLGDIFGGISDVLDDPASAS
jgi:pilus assembly protein Flp/PilA